MILGLFYKVFTTSGSWTAPTGLAFPPAVYATGEGGNSGVSSQSGSKFSGGGGGGGAFGGEPALGGVAPGTVLTITIGAGGTGTPTTVTGGSVTVEGENGTSGSNATAGSGGAAGSNRIAQAGGNGAAGISGSNEPGGAGGGSAGSTGAGGAGSGQTGGPAGTGAAGPPSLAGAAGAAGAAGGSAGNNGNAPGSGAGGPGNTNTRSAADGAPGQVIIIWAVWLPTSPRRGSAPLRMTGSSRGLAAAPVSAPTTPAPFHLPGGPSKGQPAARPGRSQGHQGALFVYIPPAPFYLPHGPSRGAQAARRGTSKGSAGAPLVTFPSAFTPPRKPARGASAAVRGRGKGLPGKYTKPPGPSPFYLPGKPSKGAAAARRGHSAGSPGAPYVFIPPFTVSPFTPPRGPSRGRMAARAGRSTGTFAGQGAPFVPRALIISIASAAGTDDYGNAFPLGISIGAASAAQIQSGFVTAGAAWTFPLNNPDFIDTIPGVAALGAATSGTPEYATIELAGPEANVADHTDVVVIGLNSANVEGSSSANGNLYYASAAGDVTQVAWWDDEGWHFNGSTQALPFGTVSGFPLSGSATLGEVISALNGLYSALQDLGII